MALTGDQIEAVTRGAADLYRGAEQAILAEVTRRLATGQDAPDWAVARIGALGALRQSVERILALVSGRALDLITEMLAAAYRSGQGIATRDLPAALLRDAPDLTGVERAAPRIAVVENLAAALVSDIEAKHSSVLRRVLDVYRQVIAQATGVSVAGGMTRRQASQWAYQRFVDQGVTSFTDSRGRRWRLSSYVEMGARTVTQRAAVQGQTDRLTSLGVDTVIVSDSPRECPLCRPWEGKVLSISGTHRGQVELPSMVGAGTVTVDIAGSVEQARAAGLQHPNCTHALRSYLPGATRRPARPTANPAGYEAKERQRAIERQIRRWKERETAALTPEASGSAKSKVREWQTAMRDHLATNPELKRLPYREQIGGGNLPGPRAADPGSTPRPVAPTGAVETKPPALAPAQTRPAPATRTLADQVRQPVTSRQPLTGGVNNAGIEVVEFVDGSRAVLKIAKSVGGTPARVQHDAEELAGSVLRALGLPAPNTHRASARRLWMDWVDARPAAADPTARRPGTHALTDEWMAHDDIRLMGLADVLVENYDRNLGNWLIRSDGRPVPIDHGFAFIRMTDPRQTMIVLGQPASHYIHPYPRLREWADNDLHPDDVAEVRRRLRLLRPEFERLGHLDWFEAMLARLDIIGDHATGRRRRIT